MGLFLTENAGLAGMFGGNQTVIIVSYTNYVVILKSTNKSAFYWQKINFMLIY